jgi:TRAP-type mannitol/chloroaromatic compound transport system substrate-binding protein
MISHGADHLASASRAPGRRRTSSTSTRNDFAKKVNDMAGGRLKIEVLPAGAVVPAFQLLDAVGKGTLDGGHGVLRLPLRQADTALALWGSGPAFGMDPNMLLAWHYYGGGKELLAEDLQGLEHATSMSFLYGPMPTQPLGWFKKPIAKRRRPARA